MLRRCLAAEAKIYSMRPLQEAKFPLPYSLNFITIKFRYWMIISVSKKKFFNSILSGLKSISLRKMIAFFHSFVPVRHLAIFILFCFALIFSFPPTSKLNFFFWKRGGGGWGLQSPHKISVNAFSSGKPFFVFTFGFHVTRSQNSPLGYNRVKPVFAADRLSSFAHFDFLASLRRKLRNGAERNWKKGAIISVALQVSKTWYSSWGWIYSYWGRLDLRQEGKWCVAIP